MLVESIHTLDTMIPADGIDTLNTTIPADSINTLYTMIPADSIDTLGTTIPADSIDTLDTESNLTPINQRRNILKVWNMEGNDVSYIDNFFIILVRSSRPSVTGNQPDFKFIQRNIQGINFGVA